MKVVCIKFTWKMGKMRKKQKNMCVHVPVQSIYFKRAQNLTVNLLNTYYYEYFIHSTFIILGKGINKTWFPYERSSEMVGEGHDLYARIIIFTTLLRYKCYKGSGLQKKEAINCHLVVPYKFYRK